MIKKVFKINTLIGKYTIPLDVFQFIPPLITEEREIEYLTGGFYQSIGYRMSAFYESDERGNIKNSIPIIQEEGINSYSDIFEQYEYILL